MNRFQELRGRTFDLIVIGGGIIGAGIARDAALRGLKVALFEKSDFGSGTTSGSTRLIHGGLRYLEIFDFRLVRLDLREREILLRMAPHLVKPLEFLIPFYDRSLYYRMKIKLGMTLYDILSYDKSLGNHRFLSPAEVKTMEPLLREEGMQGAVLYYDAKVDSPERLCLENVIDARENGACTLNYVEVVAALRSGRTVEGVAVRDVLGSEELEVRGRMVVNATGPWFDRVAGVLTSHPQTLVRTTKGIHIASPPVNHRALVLFSKIDGRLFFLIPWCGHSWIGTTDTDFHEDPGQARATGADVNYLLQSVREFFPNVDPHQIHFSNAGVRALVMQGGSESSVSRMHRIIDGEQVNACGLVSVLGGKITGYRAIAEEVTNLVCTKLKVKRSCETATLPLPGARGRLIPSGAHTGLAGEVVEHLYSLYGSRANEVLRLAELEPELGRPLGPDYADIAAQVIFAIRSEQCLHLNDFLLRRTLLGFTRDQGSQAIEKAVFHMARELSWSDAQISAEVQSYYQYLARTQKFQQELECSGNG
ncbi:glycerol-3-phosphate dehydrogenase/oxidase [Acidobacteria bacterium AH-259-D05]|nr:glycerol-3-phosphate dehydrogenase/oxidase [Acidobacteria bacterium AH-259-D05]